MANGTSMLPLRSKPADVGQWRPALHHLFSLRHPEHRPAAHPKIRAASLSAPYGDNHVAPQTATRWQPRPQLQLQLRITTAYHYHHQPIRQK